MITLKYLVRFYRNGCKPDFLKVSNVKIFANKTIYSPFTDGLKNNISYFSIDYLTKDPLINSVIYIEINNDSKL